MARLAFIACLSWVWISSVSSTLSKCDYGYAARTFMKEKEVTSLLYTIKNSRSKLDCTLMCLNEDLCSSSYRSQSGTCYLTGYSSQGATVNDFTGWKTVSPYPISGSRTCADLNCPANSVCLYSCEDGGEPMAYCTADTQSCATSPQFTNVAHYYTPLNNDDLDTGYVQRMPYVKKHSYTYIRVQWYGTLRAHYQTSGCGRWRVLFGGSDCSSPGRIEYIDYDHKAVDDHRMSDVDGICYNIAQGPVEVGLYVSHCDHYGTSNSYTGWQNPRHAIIYEIDGRSGVDKSCPGLSMFNSHQDASVAENGGDQGTIHRTLSFVKTASDTSIYVQYNSNCRVYYADSALQYCGRWYFAFNGAECSNPGKIDMVKHPTAHNNNAYNHRSDPHKHSSIHGICHGIGAGTITITLRLSNCLSSQNGDPADMYSGWNSMSRILAQEVRIGLPVAAVITSEGLLVRIAFFNLAYHQWQNINSDTDNGVIKTVSYTKALSDTGLQMTWMSDLRCIGHCCRWFFKIDGAECGNPGTISGVGYVNYEMNYHRPGTISGICRGVSAGSHSIQLFAGTCPGYGQYDGYTGWQSSSHMVITEVQADRYLNCHYANACTDI